MSIFPYLFFSELQRWFALCFTNQPKPIKNFDNYATMDKSIASICMNENLSFEK